MNKLAILFICLLISSQSFSQSKSTFSLGSGYDSSHNGFLTPYNMKGAGRLNVNYENEKLRNDFYKTITGINLGVSSLRLDYDFANKLDKGPYNFNLGISISRNHLFKLYELNHFSFWSGFVSSIQSCSQVISYLAIIEFKPTYHLFLNYGVSGGLSTSARFQFNKFIVQNTSSFFLINAMLYPNYAYDLPLPGNHVPNYFTLALVNKRQYLTNRFQVDFPLYINDKLVNSLSLSYLFNYENSNINDIAIRKYEHIFSLGVIFTIGKIDILTY